MEKVRWGILGNARIARGQMIPSLQSLDSVELIAIASRTKESAEAVAKEFNIPKAYAGYEALLADPEVEAVYIPLPVNLHAEWAIRCAEACKHALVEKPFTATAEEAEKVGEAFAARGLVVGEAFMYRFHPLTRKALEIVHAGDLGTVRTVHANFLVTPPGDRATNIRFKKETRGGALWDLGGYCVSFLRAVAGEEPTSVTAKARFSPESGVDEAMSGVLNFSSGLIGTFNCDLMSNFVCTYEIIGTEGRLRCDNGALVAWPGGKFALDLWKGGEHERIEVPEANAYALEAEALGMALRGIEPWPFSISESVENIRVMEALLASAEA